jgi:hypothetical protein
MSGGFCASVTIFFRVDTRLPSPVAHATSRFPVASAVFRDTGPGLDSNARNAFFGRSRRISTPSPFHRAIKSCGVDPSVSYIYQAM